MLRFETLDLAANNRGLLFLGSVAANPQDMPDPAGLVLRSRQYFEEWVSMGNHAGMNWLVRNGPKRDNPSAVMEDCQQVLVFGMPFPEVTKSEANHSGPQGEIASYAFGTDYHALFKNKLGQLWKDLNPVPGNLSVRFLIDANPLSERLFASLTGRGFIGRNTMFIIPGLGSRFFLATVLLAGKLLDMEPGSHPANGTMADQGCPANCRRCIDACPSGALSLTVEGNGQLDARKCLSWQGIESGNGISLAQRNVNGLRVFGCESCLEACPYNHHRVARFRLPLCNLLQLDTEGDFLARFASSAILRSGWKQFLCNVMVAAGNSGQAGFLGQLETLSRNLDPLISEHAKWAISRISEKSIDRPHRIAENSNKTGGQT